MVGSVRRRRGPMCESVTLEDGSVALVRLKPGAEALTDEDRKAISDFHAFLKKKRAEEPDGGKATGDDV